jgi:hypothetical protein
MSHSKIQFFLKQVIKKKQRRTLLLPPSLYLDSPTEARKRPRASLTLLHYDLACDGIDLADGASAALFAWCVNEAL